MSGTEWFCGVQLGGVKLPAGFPAACNSKSMVHAGTGRWRQKNGRPMLIVGSRPAVYRMAVLKPSWEMNQLIDHCIHAQEFRYLPHNCCVKIAWTLTVYFWRSIHFFTKNSGN